MTKQEIIDWLKIEFLPLQLATPDETISQIIDNAIRYWNTHSGYRIIRMYPVSLSTKMIQLDPEFKTVVKVIPDKATTWIYHDLPLWSLLGITIIDNVTSDLIIIGEAFKTIKKYLGTDFTWTFVNNQDNPDEGGYLFLSNIPVKATKVCVIGTRRVLKDEDIKDQYILDWILNYSKALLKQVEGNTLRKSDIIGVKNDGQQLFDEGKEEQKYLQEKVFDDARWVALARRI